METTQGKGLEDPLLGKSFHDIHSKTVDLSNESLRRHDQAVLTISGGALALAAALLTKGDLPDSAMLVMKVTWTCFTASLISSLLGNMLSRVNLHYEIRLVENVISQTLPLTENETALQNRVVLTLKILNGVSITTLVTGIILLNVTIWLMC